MEFIKRIIRKYKAKPSKISVKPQSFKDESDYYKWFFTQNVEWSKSTPNYDEETRWRGIKQFVENIKVDKQTGLNILDLGCGRGWLTNLLSSFGAVTGVEPVDAVAKYGKKLFPSLNIISGDSDFLLKKGLKNQYDLIVSSEVIEHVEENNKTDFVKKIFHLLQYNGYIIITTPRKESLKQYLNFINPSQPIEDWMTEKDVEELFNNNGFTTIKHLNLTKRIGAVDARLDIYQLWLFKKI